MWVFLSLPTLWNGRTENPYPQRSDPTICYKKVNDFRKSYAEKIKSDPIWLIYTRAYKQHYARFMKKTMSKTEFARWAEYALDLRKKALDDEITLEEYTELIRKWKQIRNKLWNIIHLKLFFILNLHIFRNDVYTIQYTCNAVRKLFT